MAWRRSWSTTLVKGRIIAILIHYRKNDTRSSPQPYQSLSSTRSRGTTSSSQIPARKKTIEIGIESSSISNPKCNQNYLKYSSSITNPESTILIETLGTTFLSFTVYSSCSRLYRLCNYTTAIIISLTKSFLLLLHFLGCKHYTTGSKQSTATAFKANVRNRQMLNTFSHTFVIEHEQATRATLHLNDELFLVTNKFKAILYWQITT
mgnify:FL=1